MSGVSTTWSPAPRRHLIKVVEQQLLEAHMQTMLDRGFDALMAEQRIPDLARFHSLAGRVQAQPILKQRFKDYIRTSGLALIMDEEKVMQMLGLQMSQVCKAHGKACNLLLRRLMAFWRIGTLRSSCQWQ